MEKDDKTPGDSGTVFIVSIILIVLGMLVSLLVWENGGRDDDANFFNGIGEKPAVNNHAHSGSLMS